MWRAPCTHVLWGGPAQQGGRPRRTAHERTVPCACGRRLPALPLPHACSRRNPHPLLCQGFAGELDVDAELERLEGGGAGASGRGRQPKGRPGERFTPREKSKKREQRDSKYGFGGPKRLRKQNDASSAADVDGYRPSRFDDGVARKVRRARCLWLEREPSCGLQGLSAGPEGRGALGQGLPTQAL